MPRWGVGDQNSLIALRLKYGHSAGDGGYLPHLGYPDGYACADLNWTLKRYGDARGQLIKAELICFDPAHSVVLITRWFKHNPPASEDHVTGIERLLERLPSEELAQMAMEALTESWESIQAAKMQRRDKAANAAPNGLGRLNTNHLNGRR
jgi:hypothetical protein